MKIIFYGSSDYCIPILQSLSTHFNLVAIITKPDRLIGRHHTPTPTAVKKFAVKHKIRFFTPYDKKELTTYNLQLTTLNLDFGIVADYGIIVPGQILEIPRYKTLNIHFSRLPQLRGASPVQYTILLGLAKAWITLFVMDERMDTGLIVWQRQVPIANDETTGSLYKKLFEIVGKELPDVLRRYASGDLHHKPQNHSTATYTKLLSRDDGYIPWEIIQQAMSLKPGLPTEASAKVGVERAAFITTQQIEKWSFYKKLSSQFQIGSPLGDFKFQIERTVRALSPWPGVWTFIEIKESAKDTSGVAGRQGLPRGGGIKKRLKILKAHLEQESAKDTSGVAGLSRAKARELHRPACRQGRGGGIKLKLDLVQLEGKKPVSWKQFTQGYLISAA